MTRTSGYDSSLPRLSAIVPATDRPQTLVSCRRAIDGAEDGPDELLVIEDPPGSGPAAARNAGGRRATGDVLVFVDSDVAVHGDAFVRIRRAFEAAPALTALFGSYDAAPGAPGAVSVFRNLLHHHVHQSAAGPAGTFWAGLGAIRREAFLEAGGFDARRFPTSSIEDIELGMRLVASGARIELNPELLGTHLKRWTLRGMVRTDLLDRGVPWLVLLADSRSASSALNLGWRHRLSMAASVAAVGLAMLRRPVSALCALVGLVGLNRSFYGLLWRRGGPRLAIAGVGLHGLHHLTAAAALPIAAVVLLRRRGGGARASEASPSVR